MEKSNSEKIQDIYSIAQSTHKEADENKKFCESFYESNTKQGTIATTAVGLLQKQLQGCDFFCGVLEKRLSLLIGEALSLLREDKEVLVKFEEIVEKLSKKSYAGSTLYDFANVEEIHNIEAKKEILEIEKISKLLESMKTTSQAIMAELTKYHSNWKTLFDEISLMVVLPHEIQKNSLSIMTEKIAIEIRLDHIDIDINVSDETVNECNQKLEIILTASKYLKSAMESCQKKVEMFKSLFNQGNNLNDFFQYFLTDCHYFYQTTNKLASVLRAHYHGFRVLFENLKDNTSKYESSLDAFDKWAEESERQTQAIKEMKLVVEECQKKLTDLKLVETEKREKFEKEYARFLPDELITKCPIPEIKVCFTDRTNRKGLNRKDHDNSESDDTSPHFTGSDSDSSLGGFLSES